MKIFFNSERSSSTIFQINLCVCLCQSLNSSFKRFISQSEHSFRLIDQSENSILDQLYTKVDSKN